MEHVGAGDIEAMRAKRSGHTSTPAPAFELEGVVA
jgi:hypothetical protein